MIADPMEAILASPNLPQMPAAAMPLMDAIYDRQAGGRESAARSRRERRIRQAILSLAGTWPAARARPTGELEHALAAPDIQRVTRFALGFAFATHSWGTADHGLDPAAHWRRSLFAGSAARTLAVKMDLPHPDEFFLAGLLSDLGMIAMSAVLQGRYHALLPQVPDHDFLAPLEREALGLDHAAVGAAIAKRHDLPERLRLSIRHHESPELARRDVCDDTLVLVDCVAVAGCAADLFAGSSSGRLLLRYLRAADQHFNLSTVAAEKLFLAICDEAEQLRGACGFPEAASTEGARILESARDAVVEVALQYQHQNRLLADENRRLAHEAGVDALTGVANRRRFDEIMAREFQRARDERRPLSLLLIDLDHLKQVNDLHGHLAGDRALIELTDLLRRRLYNRGHTARYGGDEFAIILPTTPLPAAIRIANDVRRQIASLALELDAGQRVPLKASLGVVTYDGVGFDHAVQLIQAADRALYAAKSAGRGSVRHFKPRRGASMKPPGRIKSWSDIPGCANCAQESKYLPPEWDPHAVRAFVHHHHSTDWPRQTRNHLSHDGWVT